MARLDVDLSNPRVLKRPSLLLLLAEQPDHGYDLVERLRSLGFDTDGAGPLYQMLRRLEAEGLVASSWQATGPGPARRTYRLTAAGWATLGESAEAIARLRRLLGLFESRYRAVARAEVASAVEDSSASA